MTTQENGHDGASSEGTVTVTEADPGTYTQQITAAHHRLVADEPQPIAISGEPRLLDECAQLVAAALDVADGMPAHCRIPGIASRKGAIGASKCCPSASTIS